MSVFVSFSTSAISSLVSRLIVPLFHFILYWIPSSNFWIYELYNRTIVIFIRFSLFYLLFCIYIFVKILLLRFESALTFFILGIFDHMFYCWCNPISKSINQFTPLRHNAYRRCETKIAICLHASPPTSGVAYASTPTYHLKESKRHILMHILMLRPNISLCSTQHII
jgi:hypothetical protein